MESRSAASAQGSTLLVHMPNQLPFLTSLRLVIPLADQASPDSERPRALLQVGGSGDWLQLPSHVVVMGSRITGACPCAATVRVSAGMKQGG